MPRWWLPPRPLDAAASHPPSSVKVLTGDDEVWVGAAVVAVLASLVRCHWAAAGEAAAAAVAAVLSGGGGGGGGHAAAALEHLAAVDD